MFPVLSFTVENMRHTLSVALDEYVTQMDTILQQAVKDFCESGTPERIIRQEADRVLEQLIRDEVVKFFRFGEGRKAVAAEVHRRLLARETYTPVDEVDETEGHDE